MLNRLQEIPNEGPICDLLWSDPEHVAHFRESPRGAGYLFGESAVNEFNEVNGLELICRGHQMVMQGFQYWFSQHNLVTVWSAPNYCYRCENIASILTLDNQLNQTFRIFKEVKLGMWIDCRMRINNSKKVRTLSISLVFSLLFFVKQCVRILTDRKMFS